MVHITLEWNVRNINIIPKFARALEFHNLKIIEEQVDSANNQIHIYINASTPFEIRLVNDLASDMFDHSILSFEVD